MAALALFFFTALSLNLILGFALGIREFVQRERSPSLHLYYPWPILFISTLLLWAFFARITSFSAGLLDLVLIFPFSVLASCGLEKLLFILVKYLSENKETDSEQDQSPGMFSIGSPYNGLAAAAVFLTMHFALTFTDAVLLSLAFSLGGLFAFIIIKEIQKRSFLESIPYILKGPPILLISMGLLSMVFSAAAVLFLKIFM